MKNKRLIICLICFLSVITFSLFIFLITYLRGDINFKKGIISFGSKSSNVTLDKTFKIDDVHNIEIKQDAGDIIFRETSDDNIRVLVYGENENNVNVSLHQNNLNIYYTHKPRFGLFSFRNIKNDIIVYIPSNYSNGIKIKNDYGNCEMLDLENAKVNIDIDAGNVELGKINNATIKCDSGNVEVKEILNKCDIKADCGNIKINKMLIVEDSIIKADLGNVEIGETNDIYIDANVDLGNININKNNKNSNITLKIYSSLGNISISK